MKGQQIITLENRCPRTEELKIIRHQLKTDAIVVLAFRDTILTDKEFKMMVNSAATSRKLRHLSMCVNQVVDTFRVQTLARAITKNSSLIGLQ